MSALPPGTALRMKAAHELDANVERSWRPVLGKATWYLAGSGDGVCAVSRTYGGYNLEFIGCDVFDMFDELAVMPAFDAAVAQPIDTVLPDMAGAKTFLYAEGELYAECDVEPEIRGEFYPIVVPAGYEIVPLPPAGHSTAENGSAVVLRAIAEAVRNGADPAELRAAIDRELPAANRGQLDATAPGAV